MGIQGDEHLRRSTAQQTALHCIGVGMTAILRAQGHLGRFGDEGIT
jgi:hypothetical protein